MRPAAPGHVLQHSLIAWGLGDLELGRRGAGLAWLAAEAVGLAALVYLGIALADSTWYLLPYLLGIGLVSAWGWQAIAAYRRARRAQRAVAPAATRSPAAGIAWLTLPLLAWGAGFWLFGADAASPSAALDRMVIGWADSASGEPSEATATLAALCAARSLRRDCADDPAALFRDVRLRIVTADDERATAIAEAVELERRPARFLWLFESSELVPVAREAVLRIRLESRPAPLPPGIEVGARRWEIVAIRPG